MGKYGIGARVRHEGDEGTITEKRKGQRRVVFDCQVPGGEGGWWEKSELTPVGWSVTSADGSMSIVDGVLHTEASFTEAIEAACGPSSCCTEKGEVAFAVGDRVVWPEGDVGHEDVRPAGSVGVVEAYFDARIARVLFDGPFQGWGDTNRNWHVTIAALVPFTLEAGKFYRTRDGRKVGPIEAYRDSYSGRHPWQSDGYLWQANGINYDGPDDPYTIVAEWVEPATAAEWTDFDHWDAPPVAVAPATATPQPKFKVGDRVVALQGTALLKVGQEYDILRYKADEPVVRVISDAGKPHEMTYVDEWFELAPTTPTFVIGNAVTATGYIAGANGSNFSVVFGDRSYDLPATSLKKAA